MTSIVMKKKKKSCIWRSKESSFSRRSVSILMTSYRAGEERLLLRTHVEEEVLVRRPKLLLISLMTTALGRSPRHLAKNSH